LRGPLGAEFAGFVAAVDAGYYDALGLDVTLVPGTASTDPVALGSESDGPEFVVAWVPAVLQRRGVGQSDLVDIGQVFQRSGTLSISPVDAAITRPADLKDRRVGILGNGDGLEIVAGLRAAGLRPDTDLTLVTQAGELDGPVPRSLDVAQASIYDGFARVLESRAPKGGLYQPNDLDVINWNDHGTAMLQDAVFARAAWLDGGGNEDVARRFLRASFRGWIRCQEAPADCVQAILAAEVGAAPSGPNAAAGTSAPPGTSARPAASQGVAASGAPGTSAEPGASTGTGRAGPGAGHLAWGLNEVNPLIWPAPAGIGVMDPDRWRHTVDVCLAAGIIPAVPGDDAYRTDLAASALAELSDLDTTGSSFVNGSVDITAGGE
jgi:NitT/TauT family transport system substrate-binding protein